MRLQLQPAERFSAERQARQGGVRLKAWIVQRSRSPQREAKLAGDGEALAAQSFDAGQVDPGAFGVQLEAVGFEAVTARSRDLACLVAHRQRGQIEVLVGDVALRADAGDLFAVDTALVHLDPPGAIERVDGTIGLKLRIERALNGQLFAGERLKIIHAYLGGAEAEMEL